MKTLLGLVLLGGFFWVLKVISDELVDKVPRSWYTNLANAQGERIKRKRDDPWDDWENSPEFSCMADNVWHTFDNHDHK